LNSLNSPALIGKSKDLSCVAKVSEEEKPVIEAEKMEFRVRWKSDTGKCVDASPLVVIPAVNKSSITVYIGSHSHRMKAIDLYSGKVKWDFWEIELDPQHVYQSVGTLLSGLL
jgi:acyl-CoA synthetase